MWESPTLWVPQLRASPLAGCTSTLAARSEWPRPKLILPRWGQLFLRAAWEAAVSPHSSCLSVLRSLCAVRFVDCQDQLFQTGPSTPCSRTFLFLGKLLSSTPSGIALQRIRARSTSTFIPPSQSQHLYSVYTELQLSSASGVACSLRNMV